MRRVLNIFFLLAFATTIAIAGNSVKPRVAGLEDNPEYMSLLHKEAEYHAKEDSISKAVADLRNKFRESTDNRDYFREEILRLESEMFDVRNEAGIIAGKISMIEQDYIIKNLDKQATNSDNKSPSLDSFEEASGDNNKANLVYNDFFRLKLLPEDYQNLLLAQSRELPVVKFLDIYLTNYSTMTLLAEEYLKVENQEDADSLMDKYRSVENINFVVADSVETELAFIIDNKLYAYNYLFDRLNMMDMLEEYEQKRLQTLDQEVQLRDVAHSSIVASYPVLKNLLFDYEKTFAEKLSIKPALDSLQKAIKAFNGDSYNVPRINMEERLFIDYADVEVHSPSKYNASNPIPECKEYERGVIYRILLGSYYRKQPVSIFKGVYPLGYVKGEDNRYRYYAGGFEQKDKALDALEELKKIGFRNPEVAVWDYGLYSILGEESDADSDKLYRVEIEGAGSDLSDEVKQAIENIAEGKDILRAGSKFFISSFESPAQAEALAETIRTTDRNLTVKISEIPL